MNVKVFIEHQNITRGFLVSKHKGFKLITRQLEKDYDNAKLSLYYIDSEGDKIHIFARSDFEYAFASALQQSRMPSPGSMAPMSYCDASTPSAKESTLRLTATLINLSATSKTVNVTASKTNHEKYDLHGALRGKGENIVIGNDTNQIVWQKGELLGTGSFGRVYSGIHMTTGNKMAVKEIPIGK